MPGDITGFGAGSDPDGLVDILDLNRVLSNWNQTCDPGDWSKGDIDGNGFVDILDMNIVLGHWDQTDPDPFIGTNVAPLAYWNSSWAFVDVMKMAKPWLTAFDPNVNLFVPTDADGWPLQNPVDSQQVPQQVFTHMFRGINGAFPAGDYVLTYEGTAEVDVVWDVTSVTIPDPGNPRRMIVTVNNPGNQGLRINIDNIDPNDPIRNIRLWMPGFEDATSPFHPLFLSRLRPFKVLRFMDWQRINGSIEVQWSDRKGPTHVFQNNNAGGVALEYIVRLCNELGAAPWFCMPHQADDNYVTNFAQYVRDNLHPNATIYVEWSNELWNSGFGQYHWLGGLLTGATGDDPFFVKWAEESANDFILWASVFTGDPRTLVRVVAGQKASGDAWILKNVLNKDAMKDPADPTGQEVLFDAVACSTYFYKKLDGNTTAVDILNNAITHISTDDAVHYQAHWALAQTYSSQTGRTIPFISYEGGQHFVRNPSDPANNPSEEAALEMQRHPLMYKAYIENISAFTGASGSLYMMFNSVSKFSYDDTFGHFEYQDESIDNTPKYRAVVGGGGR